jgi:hypothetical protein
MTRREKREARKASIRPMTTGPAIPSSVELHERQEQVRQAWRARLTLTTLNPF